MERKEGIIFDLDGVLLSTDHFHYQAWKTLADRLGIPFDERKNDLLRGVSRMESLKIILADRAQAYSCEQLEAFCMEKNDMYRALLQRLTPDFIEGAVRSALQRFRQNGYRLAVGSSSKNATEILERTQLVSAFDAVVDGNHIQYSKPDPEVFLKAAAALELSPANCIVVEDAQAGIDAAKSGGFYAVAFGPHAALLAHADTAVEGIEALRDILCAR